MTKTPEEMATDWYIRLLTKEPAFAIKEAYQAGYQAAQPQWISVKERLPNIEKTSRSLRRESTCILIASYGNVYVAHLCEDWSDRNHFIFEACICNCRAFDMDIDEWKLDQVTHWMPLPEAPKEDK